MTFRQAIQIQIKALQQIYDNAEGLRDVASDQQKEPFNLIRKHTRELWDGLKRLDNRLSDADAAYECQGNYSVKVTPADI